MPLPDLSNLSNPFSTGGGGATFEQRVAAIYLVSLLREETPRGLSLGISETLRFQARQTGALLDDLVISSSDGVTRRQLALQIKHTLKFTESDDLTQEVLAAAWATFRSSDPSAAANDFQLGRDRLGVGVAGLSALQREHLLPLFEWARACLTATEFIDKVATPHFAHEKMRAYLQTFRTLLEKGAGQPCTDDALWRFLRHFVVLDFDVENEGSRDATWCWNALLDLVPGREAHHAHAIFQSLIALAGEWAPRAATVDGNQVRAQIGSSVTLPTRPTLRADLRTLQTHSERVMTRLRDSLDGTDSSYHLPRTHLLEPMWSALDHADVVMLVGDPGSGKSGVLRALARRLETDGQPIVLRADELDYPLLEEFLQNLGLHAPLDELLSGLSATPHRCLLIDGLERALSLAHQDALHDMFVALNTVNERLRQQGAPPSIHWKLVGTCHLRSIEELIDAFPPLATAVRRNNLRIITSGVLTDQEMDEVTQRFPVAQSLWQVERLRDLLRHPLYLDIITRQRSPIIAPPSPTETPEETPETMLDKALPARNGIAIGTENWFADRFWSVVVRRSHLKRQRKGIALAREQALLTLVKRQLGLEPGPPFTPFQGLDLEAVEDLIQDRVIREQDGDVTFTHDVLADWAIYKVVAQSRHDLARLILGANESHALDRPLELFACHLLETPGDAPFVSDAETSTNIGEWRTLLASVAGQPELSPRWEQLILTAPLFSPQLAYLLPRLETTLLADAGRLLDRVLLALTTLATDPDPLTSQLFRGVTVAEQDRLAPYRRLPRQAVWLPVLAFLVRLGSALPMRARLTASTVFRMWMSRAGPTAPLRREIASVAFALLFPAIGGSSLLTEPVQNDENDENDDN